MGGVSGLGFGLVMWCQMKLVLEVREFTPLYKGVVPAPDGTIYLVDINGTR